MTGTLTGLTNNVRDDNAPIRFGQGYKVKTTKVVGTSWTGQQVVPANCTIHSLTLINVKYVPGLPLNLFLLVTTAMRQGAGQFANVVGAMITLTEGAVTIKKFDKKIPTPLIVVATFSAL
jgi:hypothetical protein